MDHSEFDESAAVYGERRVASQTQFYDRDKVAQTPSLSVPKNQALTQGLLWWILFIRVRFDEKRP